MEMILALAVVGFLVFIIMVFITRWIFRIDEIIEKLDLLIKAVEGPAKSLVVDKASMEGLKL